jgi:exodeoxyribonuclease VII small subunit
VTTASTGDDDRTFEELMSELEEVTGQLAAGDIGIEAAADLYERAERLHARAAERLDQVKARVERLTGPAVSRDGGAAG